MKNSLFAKPVKILLNYKIICALLLTATFLISVPYCYAKYTIARWFKLHDLELKVDSINFNWRPWKIPGIILNDIKIKNNGLNPFFTHINVKNISLNPDFICYFKSYFKDYNLSLNIKALKIFLINGNILESDTLTTDVNYKNNSYEINDFKLTKFKIKLDDNSVSSSIKDQLTKHERCLIIYEIKGEGQYYTLERELKIYLKAPPASTHMPHGKTYSVQAKGNINFLGLMPYQKANNPIDPGIRGKITYTIDNFSNMLHHLNQAEFISNIAKNLGKIIGYPVPRIDPFTQHDGIFTNAVSIDMTFKPDGSYMGPMKF